MTLYLPNHFVEQSRERLIQTIREWPLATIIRMRSDGLTADHVPLIVAEDADGLRLQGHVPIANPLGDEGVGASTVMVIFHGPEAYISPSWYPAKQEHGRVVPTWNYQVVQVRGQLRVIRDASWIRHQIDALTTQQEVGMESPWHVADAPAEYTTRLVDQLKGIEVKVQQLTGKTKASQNQPEANRRGVISALGRLPEGRGTDMASLVRQSLQEDLS